MPLYPLSLSLEKAINLPVSSIWGPPWSFSSSVTQKDFNEALHIQGSTFFF